MKSEGRDNSFHVMKRTMNQKEWKVYFFSGREEPMKTEGTDNIFQEIKWTMNLKGRNFFFQGRKSQ
jgi:hypothetical protein